MRIIEMHDGRINGYLKFRYREYSASAIAQKKDIGFRRWTDNPTVQNSCDTPVHCSIGFSPFLSFVGIPMRYNSEKLVIQ